MATETERYKKKPVEVLAEQFVIYGQNKIPSTIAIITVTFPVYKDGNNCYIMVPNPAGVMRANNLDWIVREGDGELYVYSDDYFRKTHSKV